MKKLSKVLSLCLALVMLLSLAACAGNDNTPGTNPPANTQPAGNDTQAPADDVKNWTGFHGWLDEDWDSKEVSYQFTGYWDMGDPEYGIAFSFLMNLYKDGSVLVNQYQDGRSDYRYFGSWELVEDPDGDELDITIAEETNEAGELIDHKYTYTVYEESDGGFSFGYDFGIAAGQYFRVANLTGSKNVAYTTVDAFHAAANEGAFVVEMEGEGDEEGDEGEEATGYSAPVMLGDNEMTATLTLDDETNATLVAAVTFNCTYTKVGSVVILELPEEPEGYQAQIWPAIDHIYVVNDEDMTMKGATAVYETESGLSLVTYADGTMRVEFAQYSMARDGFTYELSEDGTTLTVTGTPSDDDMGAFAQVWGGAGAEVWTIDGTTATPAA